ncbi:MAG: NnrS family protein [Afipia sp.]
MAIPRARTYDGPALFSYGFRPFFLFGAFYAAVAVPLWILVYLGHVDLPVLYPAMEWHAHEMIYGYLAAIITGFLLTAVPNWTGRLPLNGWPLVMLAMVWLAGRIAVAMSAKLGWVATALVDCAFLMMVAISVLREIVAGKNWSNLKVLVLVGIFIAGNIAFHLELHLQGAALYGRRIGIAAAIMLITLVGGRIVPSFTRNWLARYQSKHLPAPFGKFDMIALAAGAVSLVGWVIAEDSPITGGLLAIAGALHLVRLIRWQGYRTTRDPLVLILHIAYVFIPAGFLVLAAAAFGLAPPTVGLHVWTVGAIGGMTLAVMTRATLGHTGRALKADRLTCVIYAAIVLAAVARGVAAFAPEWGAHCLEVAAVLWSVAFLLFGLGYGRALTSPRMA